MTQQVGDDARTLAGQHRFGVELHGGEARPAQGMDLAGLAVAADLDRADLAPPPGCLAAVRWRRRLSRHICAWALLAQGRRSTSA